MVHVRPDPLIPRKGADERLVVVVDGAAISGDHLRDLMSGRLSPATEVMLATHEKVVEREEYRGQDIVIDDTRFNQCRFEQSELRYAGGGQPEFTDCIFEDCTWSFVESAGRTVELLRSLVDALGPEGDEVVEAILGRQPAFAREG